MSFQPRLLLYGAVLCAAFINSPGLDAQARFEALSRDAVAAVPGLQVVAVRDATLNVCFTLFVFAPVQPAAPPRAEPRNISDAATTRDQQLAALGTEFERGLSAASPAMLVNNPLKFQWEAQKAQSEYEHTLRQSELARIEDQLAQIQSTPRLAVSGPVSCGPPASAPR
jgi:hypothetical protein